MNKQISLGLALVLAIALLAGCGGQEAGFDAENDIMVVSREDGSGTRGAFVELFGVEEKDAEGEKVDKTTPEANITNSTAVMMTTVAGNPYAIGYVSMGSLNSSVKALAIDGAQPSTQGVKDGSYKISRPFNIVTKEGTSEAAQDFIAYIMSKEGQQIVEDSGYIAVNTEEAQSYAASGAAGKVVVAGSSSVTPVMEKLKEAYQKVNSGANIEIQQSDSTTGVTSTLEGVCDIGMASRGLKESELAGGLTQTVIAQDGIAVIVNVENTMDGLTSAQVKDIFVGQVFSWDMLE